jgi:hypothetical protein
MNASARPDARAGDLVQVALPGCGLTGGARSGVWEQLGVSVAVLWQTRERPFQQRVPRRAASAISGADARSRMIVPALAGIDGIS